MNMSLCLFVHHKVSNSSLRDDGPANCRLSHGTTYLRWSQYLYRVRTRVFIVGSFRGLVFGKYLIRTALAPPYILIEIFILVNNQLYALFSMYLFASSNPVLIIRRNELYQYIIWYMSLCVGDCLECRSGPAFQTVTYRE